MRFLAGKPKMRERLVPQGFSSLRLLVVPAPNRVASTRSSVRNRSPAPVVLPGKSRLFPSVEDMQLLARNNRVNSDYESGTAKPCTCDSHETLQGLETTSGPARIARRQWASRCSGGRRQRVRISPFQGCAWRRRRSPTYLAPTGATDRAPRRSPRSRELRRQERSASVQVALEILAWKINPNSSPRATDLQRPRT